jgi:hypothetical protein
MLDTVGGANMTQGANTQFVADRFGTLNSALNLNLGHTTVPTGLYFTSPQFTISTWIYPLSIGTWCRLIDFSNGYPSNNVIVTLDQNNNQKPVFEIVQGTTTPQNYPISWINLVLGQWQLLTCTFDGTMQRIYINGVLTAYVPLAYSMPSVSRANNYIGKSSYSADGYSSSYIDQLMFSNVSLSASEVNDMFLSDGQYKGSSYNLYSSLTNYWPITSSQMQADIVGCDDMVIQGATAYALDRFGNADSALALNGGSTQLPSGIYFNTPKFSVTAWVYPQNLSADSKLFEFSNGFYLDKIELALVAPQATNLFPKFDIFSGANSIGNVVSTIALVPGQWQFLAVTYDGISLKMYMNAVLTATSMQFSYTMPTINRANNYFGKSFQTGIGYSQSYLDDIRFYNISLTQSQVNDLINANDTSSTISNCPSNFLSRLFDIHNYSRTSVMSTFNYINIQLNQPFIKVPISSHSFPC